MRLGGTETVRVNVRIIAATNVDLRDLVAAGTFREDLYYRLNVITIDVPPLRERREDIPLLVDFFLRKYSEENGRSAPRFSAEAMKILMDCPWQGNVRELENAVERAVVLAGDEVMGPELLPDSVAAPSVRFPTLSDLEMGDASSLHEIVDAFERCVILDRLEHSGWSQTAAAESLSIPLSTLNQKIKRLGIDVRKRRQSSLA